MCQVEAERRTRGIGRRSDSSGEFHHRGELGGDGAEEGEEGISDRLGETWAMERLRHV
jgi:hypothetical protein